MNVRALVVEASQSKVGEITFDGDMVAGSGAASSIVDAQRRRGVAEAEIWDNLDGWSNGYVTFTADERAERARAAEEEMAALARNISDRKLHRYWTKGEGAVKIGWGVPGDFNRCVAELGKYVRDPKGLCAEYHHDALGVWPGQEHGRRSEVELDHDPVGELDDETAALLQAMAELDEEFGIGQQRAFDPQLHARYPKGGPQGGQFRPMVELLKMAIQEHKAGAGGHPFENFKREQLVKAAKTRGIPLKRGEAHDSIAAKLLADLGKPGLAAPNPARKLITHRPIAPEDVKNLDLQDLHDLAAELGVHHADPAALRDLVAIKLRRELNAAGKAKVAVKVPPPNTPQLAQLDRMPIKKLHEVAKQFGVSLLEPNGKPKHRWDLAVDIRQHDKRGAAAPIAKAVAAAPPKKLVAKDVDKMDLGQLLAAARQVGVDPAGKNGPELIAAVKDKLKPGNAGKYHTSTKGLEDLQNAVENGAVVRETRFAQGAIGDTRKRKYADGTELVWKRTNKKGEQDAEQLAALTARALGLQAPRIYRNRPDEINMEFMHGDVALAHRDMRGRIDSVPSQFTDTEEGRMMGLLDQLIANTDRHNGNWMIGPDGHIHPIDHGYAFGNRPGATLGHGGTAAYVRSGFATQFAAHNTWQDNKLTKKDVAEIRQRLEALRPDFVKLGRGNWHQFMLERLDAIGQHAKGTRSQLLPALV